MAKRYKRYVSDIDKFLQELIEEKPQILEEQRTGRAMWWDKKLDFDELDRARESRVRQQGYVYQNKN